MTVSGDEPTMLWLKKPADLFWPEYVPDGVLVHVHAVSAPYCTNRCFVAASLEGLTEASPDP